jgi:hypothetical protein
LPADISSLSRRRSVTRLLAAIAFAAPAAAAETITLTVSGTASPWLAGMPAGTKDKYDPASPSTVTSGTPPQASLTLQPGAALYVSATGLARVAPTTAYFGPDGQNNNVATHDEWNGIAGSAGQIPGLAGVFLTDAAPNTTPAPAGLYYYASGDKNFLSVSPLTKQVFFVGNGIAEHNGQVQRFIVPADATRLYFGVMDQGSWNNDGSFSVTVSNAMQWTNPACGTWATPGNWSQPLTPTSVDATEFNLAGNYTVNFGAVANAYSVAVNNGNVTYNLSTRTLSVAQGVTVGGTSTAPAKLTLTGGTITASTFNVGTYGTVDIASGSRVTAATSVSGGTITGNGAITGAVSNAGVISPGNGAAGLITITGTYNQTSAGTLAMQLAGVSPAQHDRLLVSGIATLGGTMAVTKVPGFEPARGDSFDLLDAGGFVQHFNNVQLPSLSGQYDRWDISRLNTEGIIAVRSQSIVDLHSGNALIPQDSVDRGVINVVGSNSSYLSEILDLEGAGYAAGKVNIHGLPNPTSDRPLYALLDLAGEGVSIEAAIANLDHSLGMPPFQVLRAGDAEFDRLMSIYDRPASSWDVALLFATFASPVDSNSMWIAWDFDPALGVTLDQLVVVPEPVAAMLISVPMGFLMRRRRR